MHVSKGESRQVVITGAAYLEELVGSLLVLLGHGGRDGLGEGPDGGEDGEADTEAESDAPGDTGVGAGRVDGAGAMGTEGDPVGWMRRFELVFRSETRRIKCTCGMAAPPDSAPRGRRAQPMASIGPQQQQLRV